MLRFLGTICRNAAFPRDELQVEGIRQQKPEYVNGGVALSGLIVQLVRADFTTDFPTILIQRFLGTTSLVDLELVLVNEFFRQVEDQIQEIL